MVAHRTVLVAEELHTVLEVVGLRIGLVAAARHIDLVEEVHHTGPEEVHRTDPAEEAADPTAAVEVELHIGLEVARRID